MRVRRWTNSVCVRLPGKQAFRSKFRHIRPIQDASSGTALTSQVQGQVRGFQHRLHGSTARGKTANLIFLQIRPAERYCAVAHQGLSGPWPRVTGRRKSVRISRQTQSLKLSKCLPRFISATRDLSCPDVSPNSHVTHRWRHAWARPTFFDCTPLRLTEALHRMGGRKAGCRAQQPPHTQLILELRDRLRARRLPLV